MTRAKLAFCNTSQRIEQNGSIGRLGWILLLVATGARGSSDWSWGHRSGCGYTHQGAGRTTGRSGPLCPVHPAAAATNHPPAPPSYHFQPTHLFLFVCLDVIYVCIYVSLSVSACFRVSDMSSLSLCLFASFSMPLCVSVYSFALVLSVHCACRQAAATALARLDSDGGNAATKAAAEVNCRQSHIALS